MYYRALIAITVAIFIVWAIAGCADNGIRVSEFNGGIEGRHPVLVGGSFNIKQGCQLSQWGNATGCFRYEGETCLYSSPGCDVEDGE